MFHHISSRWKIFRYVFPSELYTPPRSSHLDFTPQYTVNGKKIEIAVKQIVSGTTTKPSGSVANPESLQLYYKYRDLEKVLEEGDRVKSKL